MRSRRVQLIAIAIVAMLHAAAYIRYQRTDWAQAWTDQGGYRLLAEGLIASGRFTRYPDATPFVAEAIRTPGYPLFVALVFLAFGHHHKAVVAAQAVLFAAICLMVYAIARRVTTPRASVAAALVTACYAPLPYFGALILTELWTTFVITAAVLASFRARERRSIGRFALAGFCYGYAALSRPVFIFLAPCLALLALTLARDRVRLRRTAAAWTLMLLAFAITVLPWFAYNDRYFGVVTISAAGSIGRPIFESSWQGQWRGRVQSDLTDIAAKPTADGEMAEEVRQFAAVHQLDAGPMLRYVRQWRDIRRIWTTPEEPAERARARIVGDRTYLQVGVENIRRAPAAYLARRATVGLFVLWAAEIPVRYTDIDGLRPLTIRLIWLPQVILVALGAIGAVRLYRRRMVEPLVFVVGPLVYVTGVHFLLLTEARQSLPVKPLLIIAAVAAVSTLRPATEQPAASADID